MPNRILKDSICTSPNVDELSRDAEVFFYRLIVQCDDFGRMDARPAILRARCYPLQVDKVSVENISAWLNALAKANLITMYQVDGKPYLHMNTWEDHQQVRAKRSKYPEMISNDINCNQVIAYVPENPIQSESNPNPIVAPNGAQHAKHERQAHGPQQEMFGAIVETCELDPKLKQGQIAKNAKLLLDAGYTPTQVRDFKSWWTSDTWRSEHTPVPSITQLLDKLGQVAKPPPPAKRKEKRIGTDPFGNTMEIEVTL